MSVANIVDALTALQNAVSASHCAKVASSSASKNAGGNEGSGVSTQVSAGGGLMASVLHSLQQVLGSQTTMAASGASTAVNSTVTGTTALSAATLKDLRAFLYALFQVVRTWTLTPATNSNGDASNCATATSGNSLVPSLGASAATAPTVAATGAATGPTAGNSDADTDGGSGQTFGPNQHFGLGAYRSHLTSGLQSVLQQLKNGSADAGGATTPFSELQSAFQSLIQDCGGTQTSVSTRNDPSTSAKLQSFLTNLIGNLQSKGDNEPALSGAIVSTVA